MPIGQDLQDAIDSAATQFGVAQQDLTALVNIESGGNINANNGVAFGPFQLTRSTAQSLGVSNPFDVTQSSIGAATYWTQIKDALSRALGTAPDSWQVYVGYQQGPGGAKALFSADPNANAAQTLINAGVNPKVAGQSIAGNLGSDFAGDKNAATVGQFLGYWQNKWATAGGQAGTATGNSTGSTSSSSLGWSDWAGHWIVRIFVFLLGLVFVAAGLFLLSKTGKLAIDFAQANAAGNLANKISPSPVTRAEFINTTPVAAPKVKSDAPRAQRRTKQQIIDDKRADVIAHDTAREVAKNTITVRKKKKTKAAETSAPTAPSIDPVENRLTKGLDITDKGSKTGKGKSKHKSKSAEIEPDFPEGRFMNPHRTTSGKS